VDSFYNGNDLMR